MGVLGLLTNRNGGGGGGVKKSLPSSLKSVTISYIDELGTVIPYLKKIQKNHKSHDTPLEFC